MRDADRRARERAPEDPAAAAALLPRARLRGGDLTREALGRAAALGHLPAQLALGQGEASPGDVRRLLGGLSLRGSLRAALALWGEERGSPAWEAAAAWAREPTPARHAAARALLLAGGSSASGQRLLGGVVRGDADRLRRLALDAARPGRDLGDELRAALVPWLLGEADPLGAS